MLLWEIRIVTFITNLLLLVGYALLYNWLQNTKFTNNIHQKLRTSYLVSITIAFLILFHSASELSIIQNHNNTGFGWTYINFQIATVLYALLSSRKQALFYSLSVVTLSWYWWLPNVSNSALFYVVTLIMMWLAQRFGITIGTYRTLYYPFCLLFVTPFLWANLISLRGIDVGWPWELITTLLICWLLWEIHYLVKRQHIRQAVLLREARTDKLTHLNNFRVFNEDLLSAYSHLTDPLNYSLYTFDIDHFKQINDQYGHLVGNQVLEQVSARLNDILAQLPYHFKTYRTGGEEFSFILFDTARVTEHPTQIANLVRDELSQLKFTVPPDQKFNITISLGQDHVLPDDRNYMDIYSRADERLYQSKHRGRNTICVRPPMNTPK